MLQDQQWRMNSTSGRPSSWSMHQETDWLQGDLVLVLIQRESPLRRHYSVGVVDFVALESQPIHPVIAAVAYS